MQSASANNRRSGPAEGGYQRPATYLSRHCRSRMEMLASA